MEAEKILKVADYTFSYSSSIDEIEFVKKGMNFENFKSFYDSFNLPNKKWAEIIGVSEKTMQSILKKKRFLDQKKTEKLLSFLSLVVYGVKVFGNRSNFKDWLHYKSPALNGLAPIDYVDTFQGINMLKEQLFKIESGNLV